MADTFWQKQNPDKPLFPDLLWSRPEHAQGRGKLLIIGGNQYGFAAPAEAYGNAVSAGAGLTRVLLPQAVKKIAGALLPNIEYAPNTPSGSFARSALEEFINQAAWAEGVLFAGDLGHNSETAILLDSFLAKYSGQVTLTKDAADYFLTAPEIFLDRPDTLLVITMAELQKLGTQAHFNIAFRLGMDLLQLVDGLHALTTQHAVQIIVKHLDQLVVAVNGNVSTTIVKHDMSTWRIKTAASAAVWWLQNPKKPFESLSTAVFELVGV